MSDDDGGDREIHRSGLPAVRADCNRAQAHHPVARQHRLYSGKAIDERVEDLKAEYATDPGRRARRG